jgi:hypothetical protein
MSEHSKEVSRDTLERLVARALELDERGVDRISLTKAREIALELGISEAAWDAAVAERTGGYPTVSSTRPRAWGLRTMLTAGVGFSAGVLGGWLNRAFNGDLDVIYAALLVVAGIVISAGRNAESYKPATARLDAWWLAVPAGLLLALGGIRTDPLLFAAFARWGTGWVMSNLPLLLRPFRDEESQRSASTA